MSALLSIFGHGLIAAGVCFLALAALGLWRLPDLLSRLHVLTKADTAGLALIALGAACLSGSRTEVIPLVLCVLLTAIGGATVGQFIARSVTPRADRS